MSLLMFDTPERIPQKPIDMVLYCPQCGFQHIDAPDPKRYLPNGNVAHGCEVCDGEDECTCPGRRSTRWTNRPHRSHLCGKCGFIWRPADVETNGVRELQTAGQRDDPKVAYAHGGLTGISEQLDTAIRALTDTLEYEWTGEFKSPIEELNRAYLRHRVLEKRARLAEQTALDSVAAETLLPSPTPSPTVVPINPGAAGKGKTSKGYCRAPYHATKCSQWCGKPECGSADSF